MHQYFGIGVVGLENVSLTDKDSSQLEMVIDFAIEDYPDLSIFVPHGLLATLNVQDCESSVCQVHGLRLVDIDAGSIRSSMRHRIAHGLKVLIVAPANESGDPAHLYFAPGRLIVSFTRYTCFPWDS